MGEGYHNYHHEFQHDYRNGVKPWQFDPTKWLIWTLSKLRLVRNLRRVPADKIRSAQRETGANQGDMCALGDAINCTVDFVLEPLATGKVVDKINCQ